MEVQWPICLKFIAINEIFIILQKILYEGNFFMLHHKVMVKLAFNNLIFSGLKTVTNTEI